jgi:hypothetical protein
MALIVRSFMVNDRNKGSPFPLTVRQCSGITYFAPLHLLRPQSMPPTYSQCTFFLFGMHLIRLWADWLIPEVIDLALTAAAKEDREWFSLTWLRQQGEECLL